MEHPYNVASTDDVKRVMDYANTLGLHGVIILSPVCKQCGGLHQWSMLTDMAAVDGKDSMVRDVLAYHLERVDREPPVDLGPARGPDG